MVLETISSWIECALAISALLAGVELLTQRESSQTACLLRDLFQRLFLSLSTRAEEISPAEEESVARKDSPSLAHSWVLKEHAVLSFVLTPHTQLLIHATPLCAAHRCLLPLLEISAKFYAFHLLGRERCAECVRAQHESPRWTASLSLQLVCWACTLRRVSVFDRFILGKLGLLGVLVFSTHRWASMVRNSVRRVSLALLCILLAAVDVTLALSPYSLYSLFPSLSPFALYSSSSSSSSTTPALSLSFPYLSAIVLCLAFLPLHVLFYQALFRPKQLLFKEYVQLLLRARGLPVKTLKMKRLLYYLSTSESLVAKELPAGVSASVIEMPFSSGAMRDAFYVFLQPSNTLYHIETLDKLFFRQREFPNDLVVGKAYKPHIQKLLAKKGVSLREQMCNDLYMHKKAQEFSLFYNQHAPPKPVNFVQAAIFESEDGQLLWVEEKISGRYDKYSNNAGWVNHTRLSPHAFSHFTYHHSNHKLVVVDMQGAEKYTDPQIHSIVTIMNSVWQFLGLEKKEEFGCGNLGKQGIDLWKESHECSDLCRALGLPEVRRLSTGSYKPSKSPHKDSQDQELVTSTIMSLKQR